MLKSNLLNEIGFSYDMQKEYQMYYNLIGDETEKFAYRYMRCGESLQTVLSKLHILSGVNVYTLDLIFVLLCTGYLYEDYKAKNLDDDVFINTMKDIKCKVIECKKYKNVFGTFVIDWYEGILKMEHIAFGRLLFNILKSYEHGITLENYEMKPNSFCVVCHIPSGSPLVYDEVIASYKMVYDYTKEYIKDGILPILCFSWLLYPKYKEIFKRNSPNIAKFASDYAIYQAPETTKFHDAWRVFYMDCNDGIEKLPRDTRLQRAFIDYINAGGGYGEGYGILLFDGEKVLDIRGKR